MKIQIEAIHVNIWEVLWNYSRGGTCAHGTVSSYGDGLIHTMINMVRLATKSVRYRSLLQQGYSKGCRLQDVWVTEVRQR